VAPFDPSIRRDDAGRAHAVTIPRRSLRGGGARPIPCASEAGAIEAGAAAAVGRLLAHAQAVAQQLELDVFWAQRLPPSHKGIRFDQVLFVLVAYRLLSPGSEWRLHRHWFEKSALADLLGADAVLADIHMLCGCRDRLLEHKQAVLDRLVGRWRDLFNARFDILL